MYLQSKDHLIEKIKNKIVQSSTTSLTVDS